MHANDLAAGLGGSVIDRACCDARIVLIGQYSVPAGGGQAEECSAHSSPFHGTVRIGIIDIHAISRTCRCTGKRVDISFTGY